MRNISNYKIFTFLMLVIFLIACDKLTDLEPRSEVSQENFWVSEDDAIAGLLGVYSEFRNIASDNLIRWGEGRADVWVNRGTNGTAGFAEYLFNTIDVQTPGANWNALYTMIHRSNLVIAKVPNMVFIDENKKNRIIAEAYANRAFAYFVISRTWGDAPIRTEPTDGDSFAAQLPRSSKNEVLDQVKSDIETALSLFTDDSFVSKYRWSRPAVNALKGDVYLWSATVLGGGSADFTTALNALNLVSGVTLLTNFDDIFDVDENSEILLAMPNGELEGVNTISSNFFMNQAQWPGTTIGDPVVFEKVNGLFGGITIAEASDYAMTVYEKGDLRREATQLDIIFDGTAANPSTPDGMFINPITDPTNPNINNDQLIACLNWKFSGFINSTGSGRIFRNDIPIYRYGEVLLLIAEAKIGLGQDPSTEINLIRERGFGVNYVEATHAYVYNAASAIDDLLDERLRELQFEGKRWWDLIKYNKVFDMVPSLIGRQGDANVSVYYPINNDAKNRNPLLNQTEGYDPF